MTTKIVLLLGLILVLQHAQAFAIDPQLQNTSVQVNGVLNPVINSEQKSTDQLLRKHHKSRTENTISIRDAQPDDEQVAGNRFHKNADGSMMVLGGNATADGMNEIANTETGGELQPVILLLQVETRQQTKKPGNIIRINAQTIQQLKK